MFDVADALRLAVLRECLTGRAGEAALGSDVHDPPATPAYGSPRDRVLIGRSAPLIQRVTAGTRGRRGAVADLEQMLAGHHAAEANNRHAGRLGTAVAAHAPGPVGQSRLTSAGRFFDHTELELTRFRAPLAAP